MTLTFQTIHRGHDRNRFDCGKEPLNRFLRETARRNEDQHITRTYVLVDAVKPSEIIAYYTLVFCQVDPPRESRLYAKYPHTLAGLKLARMAVDLRFQEQGHGKYLLVHAVKKTCQATEFVAPVYGLFVDAKDNEARRFYEQYGFRRVQGDPLVLWLPIQHCQALVSKAE